MSYYDTYILSCQYVVGATGLEPATSRSQTVCATNCATPRYVNYNTDKEKMLEGF